MITIQIPEAVALDLEFCNDFQLPVGEFTTTVDQAMLLRAICFNNMKLEQFCGHDEMATDYAEVVSQIDRATLRQLEAA